ncbi:MAG TPA: hypothetical protein VMH81_37600 [Bryobacteraceae bacterium]|nr:hypothetical protein [Bryobacteraceae bacterium]
MSIGEGCVAGNAVADCYLVSLAEAVSKYNNEAAAFPDTLRAQPE